MTDTPTRLYEDLEGAQGREVNFRPTRYSSEQLGPVRSMVELGFHDARHACELRDVSQNGMALVWPAHLAAPRLGDTLPHVVVRFDRYEAYRGGAAVMSVREQGGALIVGVSFTDALMDIRDVLHVRDVRSWSQESAQRLGGAAQPWQVSGFDRFKSLVGEFHLFLKDASDNLSALEKRLPWHVVHGTADTPAHAALLQQLDRDFVPTCTRYSYDIDAALRGASGETWAGLKEYSLGHLQHYLVQAAFIERALHKPLGYPGDFELMRYMYRVAMEGQTLFSKALHYAIVHQAAGEAVRQRKELLKGAMRTLIEAAQPGRTLRIASIAAGPAYEVAELLRELAACPTPVEIVLFDQDGSALEAAHGRIARADGRWPEVKVAYRHDSIKRLLKDPTMLRDAGPFDMLFCSGLFDYLRHGTAVTLCQTFYGLLAPGGRAWVGNMCDNPNPCRWLMEQHMDWFLTYRTREEMLAFARDAAPDARVEIVNEPTGINPFVVTQKPA